MAEEFINLRLRAKSYPDADPVGNIHFLLKERYQKLYLDPANGQETILQDYMVSELGLPAVQIPLNTIPLPSACSLLLLNAIAWFNLDTPLCHLLHKLITKFSVFLAQDGLAGFCLFAEVEIVTVEVVETEPIEMAIKRVESRLVIEKLQKQRMEQDVKQVEGSCAVCLEELSMEDEDEAKKMIMAMPCSHLFHESCIFRWLEEQNSCPMCRRAVELELADFNSFVACS